MLDRSEVRDSVAQQILQIRAVIRSLLVAHSPIRAKIPNVWVTKSPFKRCGVTASRIARAANGNLGRTIAEF